MKRDASHSRGQGLVEFALIVPLFLILLLGMVEFGRAWMTKNILTGAAREAVRQAAVQTDNVASTSVAKARAIGVLNSANIFVTPDQVDVTFPAERTIQVKIDYQFPLIVGGQFGLGRFFGGSSTIPLSTTTTMRTEQY